jgi:hypothetical protein
MLGAPCSPCCCGPEIESLPTRFEVDVTAINAPERHWGARWAKLFLKETIFEFTYGYVQNWHCGEITSGTYALELLSTVSGVATYQYISPGMILRATCTPASDGRYSVFFVCVPIRTTTQVWGLNSYAYFTSYTSSIDRRSLWTFRNAFGDLSPPPAVPPSGARPFETVEDMRASSISLTESPTQTGTETSTSSVPYTFKQSCHAVTVGTRLACPSVTVSGTTAANTEQRSANVFLDNNNWPMQIRSTARIYLPYINDGWFYPGFATGSSSPGRQMISRFPAPNETPGTYGPRYNLNFGFASGDTILIDSVRWSSTRFINTEAWFSNFTRDIDITQIRAIFPGSTQQWG